MDPTKQQLAKFLETSEAHADFAAAVADFPIDKRGVKPPGATHTAWELLEHLRITQRDILEFSRNAEHISPSWPEGYWPSTEAPSADADWGQSVKAFESDAQAMVQLISDPATDLLASIPHGEGQTLLREALLLIDHNAYHVGELVMLRVILGIWKG